MILLFQEIFKGCNQNPEKTYYENVVEKIHSLIQKCPLCGSHEIVGHGYYSRQLLINNKIQNIDIHRIKCKNCKRTHAVFTLDLIPWCYYKTSDAIYIIRSGNISTNNEELDELIMMNVLKRRRYLSNKYINNYSIEINEDEVDTIDIKISNYIHNSFLQIHRGNIYLNKASP